MEKLHWFGRQRKNSTGFKTVNVAKYCLGYLGTIQEWGQQNSNFSMPAFKIFQKSRRCRDYRLKKCRTWMLSWERMPRFQTVNMGEKIMTKWCMNSWKNQILLPPSKFNLKVINGTRPLLKTIVKWDHSHSCHVGKAPYIYQLWLQGWLLAL